MDLEAAISDAKIKQSKYVTGLISSLIYSDVIGEFKTRRESFVRKKLPLHPALKPSVPAPNLSTSASELALNTSVEIKSKKRTSKSSKKKKVEKTEKEANTSTNESNTAATSSVVHAPAPVIESEVKEVNATKAEEETKEVTTASSTTASASDAYLGEGKTPGQEVNGTLLWFFEVLRVPELEKAVADERDETAMHGAALGKRIEFFLDFNCFSFLISLSFPSLLDLFARDDTECYSALGCLYLRLSLSRPGGQTLSKLQRGQLF